MKSSSDSFERSVRLTRRTATVSISARVLHAHVVYRKLAHYRISPRSAQRTRRRVHFFAYFEWRVGDEELGCGLFGDGGDAGCWRGGVRADEGRGDSVPEICAG